MEFKKLLNIVGDDPVFESSLLYTGKADPSNVRLQLARWVKNGRIHRLRRGLYSIAKPYHTTRPHPFLVANHLQRSSYVSLQSALAYYGLIPDVVIRTVSVTTGRPESLSTPLGEFEFRHIRRDVFFGFHSINLQGRSAMVALPEKALLDLIYLQPDGESPEYLKEIRLQQPDILDLGRLEQFAARYGSTKMHRAAENLRILIDSWEEGYDIL